MSQIQCDSCTDLRDYAKEFVAHGVTEKVAASLANNTGLNPDLTVLHEDCEDMADVVDCLVGRMQDLSQYQNCDWKDYVGKLVPNLYETFKAVNANDCGQWEKLKKMDEMLDLIKAIWDKLQECCDAPETGGCVDSAIPQVYGDACPAPFWNSVEGGDEVFLDGGVATRQCPEDCLIYLYSNQAGAIIYKKHGTEATEVHKYGAQSFTVTFPTATTIHMVNTNVEQYWSVLYVSFDE